MKNKLPYRPNVGFDWAVVIGTVILVAVIASEVLFHYRVLELLRK